MPSFMQIILLGLFAISCSGGSGNHTPVDNFTSNLSKKNKTSEDEEKDSVESAKEEPALDPVEEDNKSSEFSEDQREDYTGKFKEFFDACEYPSRNPAEDTQKKTALAIQNSVGGLNDSCSDTVSILEKEDRLILTNRGLSDIRMLGEMKHLRRVQLGSNYLESVEAVALLKEAEYIDISENPVRDFQPLSRLRNLKELHLSLGKPGLKKISEEIASLRAIAGKEDGEILSEDERLRYTREALVQINEKRFALANLDFLAHCEKLETFKIDFTLVTDLSPLKSCASLQRISLNGLRLTDLSPLEGHPELREVRVTKGFVDPAAIDRLRKAIPHMIVIESSL